MLNAVVGPWQIVELVGYGATGTVYKAQLMETNLLDEPQAQQLVALKAKEKEAKAHDVSHNPFKQEYDLLSLFHAANPAAFVRPISCATDTMHFMITELMTESLDRWGVQLRSCIVKIRDDSAISIVIAMIRGTIEALATAHRLGYAIRDISSRNFLVKDGAVKAVDLASAVFVQTSPVYLDTRVTPRYSSHRVARGNSVRHSDDYEALCYVWIDVLTDRLAWRKCKRAPIISKIKTTCLQNPEKYYAGLPPLFSAMLPFSTQSNETAIDHQKQYEMLVRLATQISSGEMYTFIREFSDMSSDFAQYDGLF